jgi:phosphoribosylformylglycinamidine cyclo-ligase
VIDASKWAQPALMRFLQQEGNIAPQEMARTFNCGIGMVLAVHPDYAGLAILAEDAFPIGEVIEGPRGCTVNGAAGTWNADQAWSATHNA